MNTVTFLNFKVNEYKICFGHDQHSFEAIPHDLNISETSRHGLGHWCVAACRANQVVLLRAPKPTVCVNYHSQSGLHRRRLFLAQSTFLSAE